MRTVLITGASGGIGEAIARRFADEQYHVILHYHKNSDAIKRLEKALKHEGATVDILGCDLLSANEIDGLVASIKAKNISIDVLINNAGIKRDAPITEMDDEQFSSVMRVNVDGPWLLIKRMVPMMKAKKAGRIINITSGVAKEGRANQTNYAASKAALDNLTRSLARELGPYNITVNSVAPGLIETDMTKNVSDEDKQNYITRVPIGRLVEAKDVAQACVFFADPKSGAISGQVLGVNGGLR